MTEWSVTWHGREVRHPVGRVAVTAMAVLGAAIGVVVTAVCIAVIVPLCLLLHGPLRLCDRQGTIRQHGDKLDITLDLEAFRRAGAGEGSS